MLRPASFEYVAPGEVGEVVEILHRVPGATVLAGGQSLLPAMSRRLLRPRMLVDINAVSTLDGTEASGDSLSVGALMRHRDLELSPVVRERVPVLAEAAGLVGDPGVRRRGTLGGSLAYAAADAELPLVAVLLEARVEIVGCSGSRTVSASDFFCGPNLTALAPAEVVAAAAFPCTAAGEGCAVREFPARRHGSNVSAAARLVLDEAGRCTSARMVLSGVAGRPLVLTDALSDLTGASRLADGPLRDAARRAGEEVVEGGSPPPVRSLVEVVAAAALAAAWERADGVRRP